jgi:dipeptidase
MDTRQWAALRLLTGIEYDPEEMAPFSVKPNRKLSVQDIIEVLRTHYEGTEYEPEWTEPYWPHEGDPRRICVGSTQESSVMQLRSKMPSFVGNVYWRAQCTPCSTVYSPWYSGILEIPKPYAVGKSNRSSAPLEYYDPDAADDMNSAYWAFRKMTDLVEEDYLARKALVRDVWDEYEDAAFELQDRIEKTALEIYKGKKGKKGKKDEHNEYLARWFLTRQTESLALNAYFKALEFIELFEED